jgi:hypothetical protein
MSNAADIVREWILKGAHDGWNGHHPNCSTKVTEGCDCYHRKYAPALAALDALVAERDNAVAKGQSRLRCWLFGHDWKRREWHVLGTCDRCGKKEGGS